MVSFSMTFLPCFPPRKEEKHGNKETGKEEKQGRK